MTLQLQPCKWTYMLTCDQVPDSKEKGHCLACCLAWLQRAMVDEDLVTAGEHLVVLEHIVRDLGLLTVHDLQRLAKPQRIPSLSR